MHLEDPVVTFLRDLTPQKLGAWSKQMRAEKSLRQVDVTIASGLDSTIVSRIEHEKTPHIKYATFRRLAIALLSAKSKQPNLDEEVDEIA
jgi:DNA-binding Xre family transcriptional regulator